MSTASRPPVGIFTTDDRLVVRVWDGWIADATGIPPAHAIGRPLSELIPDLDARGILATFENVLARGTVEVLAGALHQYLIACAPRDPAPGFTHMRQHVTIGPLRQEGRVVGVIVTIEDVTAHVALERELAARLAESSRAAMASVGGAPGSDGSPQISALTRLLAEQDPWVRRTAVTTLAEHGNAVVASLVEALRTQHHDFDVLSSALDLLAMSDIDIVAPLIGFLADEDVNLRIQAALILGDRRDARAIPALIVRLSDPDINVRFHAIEALGRLEAADASAALIEIAESGEFFLAFAAIQSLAHAGSSALAPRLVPLLADEMLRAPAIEALGELGDEDVTVPLVQQLNTSGAPPDVIADALAGLYERYEHRYGAGEHIAGLVRRAITATGTQRLLDAVRRVSADRLPALAKVLSWLEGDAVQRALTRLLGHQTVRSQIVEALVRHGAGVVTLLVEQLRAEDLETRQAAAVALGRIGDCRATPALVEALTDPELAVPVAGALARIGDGTAFEGLLALLGNPDASVRQSAIAALNSIGHPEMPQRVAALLDDPDPLRRESALKIAGYFGYAECAEQVFAACRDESDMVRRTAIEGLPFFEDERVLPALVHALERDAAPVRAAAAAALARVEGPQVTAALTRAIGDNDSWVRYVALRSLGAKGDARVAPSVLAALRDDPAAHVRLAAIDALGRLEAADALDVLEPMTQSTDPDIAAAAIRALGHIDRSEALPVLERLLRAPESWQRVAAVAAVTQRTEPRVTQALQWVAAADDDEAVIAGAIDGLARIARRPDDQGAAATHTLIALTSETARREAAITALSELPPRRIRELADGLTHAAADVRQACVEALSRMKQPIASRVLETALDDVEPAVRLAAVRELTQLGSRTTQRKLMALARTDPDEDVRRAAMLAATRSGTVESGSAAH